MEKMRSAMKKCCMHPDQAHCKGKIKAAHALQNNKIISILAGSERHVYMMNTKKKPLLIPMRDGEIIPIVELSKTSANDATTETCFCDLHDNIAFAVIEKGAPDFDETSEKMKFIYAYKAFIFEYYKQRIGLDIFRSNFKENPYPFLSVDMVGMYRMLLLKEQEFEPIKSHFDEQIVAGTFDGVVTCAIKIPEQIKFADYAYIAPDYDMNGKKTKHTVKGSMHRVAITIFPETNQSWLLLSCLKSEQYIYEILFQQLKTASLPKLKFYINLVLPLYSENMVLSTELWEFWDEEVQMAYTYYANLEGKDAVVMGKGIGFGLNNAACQKSDDVYNNSPKINLFI
ncbi:zinc chelation protein SecC [Clostridium estertheticum]|nr:zinc chelation protein SecC [Clostridium estertheticum]MBW9171216.1 zinc chelation protein SecC [Clostridium estertheticum]